jgi:hypothetical protein
MACAASFYSFTRIREPLSNRLAIRRAVFFVSAWFFLKPSNKGRSPMYNPLRLNDTLHPNAGNGPDDTLAAKRVLAQLGYYEVPDYGLTPYPDLPMFDSIRNFQRDIGLRDDGVIKPYDATETLLNEVLSFSMRDGAKPSEGGAGGPGGQVQVKAYVQHRGGKPVQVADHVRSASGEGVGNGSGGSNSTDPLPPMSSPVANPRIRGKDGYSSGHYGASRDGGTRSHDGVDVVTEPGETVVSPVTGTYQAPFDPYNKYPDKRGKYQAVQIMTDDGHRVRVMYIDPDAVGLKQGQRVVAGETPIGKAQDLTKIYPPNKEGVMTNHTHIDVWKDGRFKDPTPIFERDVR